MYKARIVNDSWSPIELPKLKYIWKNNLTCLTILKAKSLHLKISNIILDWGRKENTRALNLVFKELFDVRIANANQFGSSVSLLEISNDKKKKKWVLSKEVSEIAKLETRIKKCLGCEYNRSIVEGNCITRIRFDMGWKVIPKNTISRIESSTQMQANFNLTSLAQETYNKNPLENEQEFKNLRSLESSEKELILQAELKEELKEEILAILTRNSNRQKRKYCYYTNGSLQKDNKDKGNTVVMGVAVVQVDKKEK
ncbi:40889_t:CDS:2, partial [Gigaspora margarita]